jgi:Flp pilus assembly protein TadD
VLLFGLLAAGETPAGPFEGRMAYEAGRFSEAAAHFKQVVEESPTSAYAHPMLGLSLDGAGESGRALWHLMEARRLAPAGDVEAAYALAYHHWKRGNHAEAAYFASEAWVVSRGGRPEILSFAGHMHVLAGDDERGEALLSQAREALTDIPTAALLALARLRLGRVEEGLRALVAPLAAPDGARTGMFQRVVPSYVGWILRQDCPPRTATYLELEKRLFSAWRAADQASTEPDLWDGILHLKAGDPDHAYELFDRARAFDPSSCAASYYAALTDLISGRRPPPEQVAACSTPGSASGESPAPPALDPATLKPLSIPLEEHAGRIVRPDE